jgi:hypothetical protein
MLLPATAKAVTDTKVVAPTGGIPEFTAFQVAPLLLEMKMPLVSVPANILLPFTSKQLVNARNEVCVQVVTGGLLIVGVLVHPQIAMAINESVIIDFDFIGFDINLCSFKYKTQCQKIS